MNLWVESSRLTRLTNSHFHSFSRFRGWARAFAILFGFRFAEMAVHIALHTQLHMFILSAQFLLRVVLHFLFLLPGAFFSCPAFDSGFWPGSVCLS